MAQYGFPIDDMTDEDRRRLSAFKAPQADRGAFAQSEKDLTPYVQTAQFSDSPRHHYSGYNSALMPTDPANQQPSSRSWSELPGRAWDAFKNLAPYESPSGDYRKGNFQHQVLPGLAHSFQNGLTSAAEAYRGNLPQYEQDAFGNTRTSQDMGQAALDAAGLAATGGIAAPKPGQMVARGVESSGPDSVAFARRPTHPSLAYPGPEFTGPRGTGNPAFELAWMKDKSGRLTSSANDLTTEAREFGKSSPFKNRNYTSEFLDAQPANDVFTARRSDGSSTSFFSNDSRAAVPGVALAGQRGSTDSLNELLRGRPTDSLGFYSKLDEVLGQFKPTDTVTSQTLAQRGVKQSELQARGLGNAFENGGAKVGDLLEAASDPLKLNEVNGYSEAKWSAPQWTPSGPVASAKYSSYSLDKGSNPTYRESVLHLPEHGSAGAPNFSGGHWSEPNVIAHMRTSMQKDAQGRPVFHVDELQSDWGQKLRDGGVRDDAKISDLRERLNKIGGSSRDITDTPVWGRADRFLRRIGEGGDVPYNEISNSLRRVAEDKAYNDFSNHPRIRDRASNISYQFDAEASKRNLLKSEIKTAEASTPGHPLVNTSDQWQTTAFRRLMRQAVDADAHGIAIPSGNTVHGYGMGTEGGSASQSGVQYAYDKMYPGALGKELAKLDPSIKRQMQPMAGHEGKGPASYFELTDAARAKIREGLPLFSNHPSSIPGTTLSHQQDLTPEEAAAILRRFPQR